MLRLLVCAALAIPGLFALPPGLTADRQLQATESTRCSTTATSAFLDSIDTASSGCATTTPYKWLGSADPTTAERTELCKCFLKPFDVPDCTLLKQGQYVVTVAAHVKFVFDCPGKAAPSISVVSVSSLTPTPTTKSPTVTPKKNTTTPSTTPSKTPSSSSMSSSGSGDPTPWPPAGLKIAGVDSGKTAPRCTDQQTYEFQRELDKKTDWCATQDVYDWAGTVNPTDDQFKRVCKCNFDSPEFPNCFIRKGEYLVLIESHYVWFREICAKMPPTEESSSSAAMIGGIIGGVVAIAIVLGIVLYKRRRSRAERANSDDMLHVPRINPQVTSPLEYREIPRTPQDFRAKPAVRGSTGGDSLDRHTATTVGTTSSLERPSDRYSERVSWDDPAITAVRIPHDAIFFGALLSRGGFGEVFMGTYKGENVAVKQLRPERRKDMVQIDNFLAEVKLMASLEHERIVRFIGVAWNSLSDACMVVEYLENGDLRSVLNRWEQDLKQNKNTARPHGFDVDKTKIALHVAHALAYLHSLQPIVVHRDLKSANVLLTRNFDAKLTDFGISRERADSTMTANIGSVLWMAPEVMVGERYDEKADIFSFGVVLSELDTHQVPYSHAKEITTGEKMPDAAIMQLVMMGRLQVAFTDRADLELVELARECISLDPTKRPSAAQLLHRVHQIHRKYT